MIALVAEGFPLMNLVTHESYRTEGSTVSLVICGRIFFREFNCVPTSYTPTQEFITVSVKKGNGLYSTDSYKISEFTYFKSASELSGCHSLKHSIYFQTLNVSLYWFNCKQAVDMWWHQCKIIIQVI